MRSALVLPLLLLSAPFAFGKPASSPVALENGYIFQPLQGSNSTAGYGILKNKSGGAITLSVASAEGFKAVELHETVSANGMMKMQKVDSIRIEPNGVFEWKPGGNHIMLFDPTKALKENDEVRVQFKSGDQKLTLPFKIKSRVEKAHDHHHH